MRGCTNTTATSVTTFTTTTFHHQVRAQAHGGELTVTATRGVHRIEGKEEEVVVVVVQCAVRVLCHTL